MMCYRGYVICPRIVYQFIGIVSEAKARGGWESDTYITGSRLAFSKCVLKSSSIYVDVWYITITVLCLYHMMYTRLSVSPNHEVKWRQSFSYILMRYWWPLVIDICVNKYPEIQGIQTKLISSPTPVHVPVCWSKALISLILVRVPVDPDVK